MGSLRKRVVTVHGVNPDRGWQEAAKAVLEPHYEVVSLDYRGYDGVQGPVRVVCHPVALVVTVALLVGVAAAWALFSFGWSEGVWSAGGVFVAGLVVAAYQRRREGKKIKTQLSEACRGPRPHLIAHSFGTYLAGRSLLYPDIELDRVVLVGSVLPRRFDWPSLRKNGREGFGEVRNEVGTRDFAVRFAGWARWLAWDIGNAGLRGFEGRWAHWTQGPWVTCPTCATIGPGGLVHNVPLAEMEHSDMFLGPGHVRRFWLPYLWGLPAKEFRELEDLCFAAAYNLQEGKRLEFNRIVGILGGKKWEWTEGSTTRDFVWRCLRAEIEARGGEGEARDEKRITEIVGVMCEFVAWASEEEQKEEAIRRALHPHLAIVAAMKRVLEREKTE